MARTALSQVRQLSINMRYAKFLVDRSATAEEGRAVVVSPSVQFMVFHGIYDAAGIVHYQRRYICRYVRQSNAADVCHARRSS